MELDQALEFAVVSSWEELVRPGEPCAIHVEYKNVFEQPLDSVEVWMTNHGYGKLVCRYSLSPIELAPATNGSGAMYFANSYQSKTMTVDLDFIMRNQSQYSRPPNRSIHGLIQVDRPSEEDKKGAALWSLSTHTPSVVPGHPGT